MGTITRGFANNITTGGELQSSGLTDGWVKVASVKQTTEASSIEYTNSVISTTYDQYKIFVSNARCNTDNINWEMTVSFDNGSSFQTGSIYYRNIWCTTDNAGNDTFAGTTGAQTAMTLGHAQSQGNAAGENGNYEITLLNPHSTINKKIVSVTGGFFDLDGDSRTHFGMWMVNSTSAISGIKFAANTNNIQSGDISIYGLKT